MSDSIKLCDPSEVDAASGPIKLCDPAAEKQIPGAIKLCGGGCLAVSEVMVTGPLAATVGAQYDVNSSDGGPFEWSISGGAINAYGLVTSVDGACGTGSVTAKNRCGSGSMVIMFPSGQWVEQSCECSNTACEGLAAGESRETIDGLSRRVDYLYPAWMQPIYGYPWPCNNYDNAYPDNVTCDGTNNQSCKSTFYSWECP